jgi:hypothetical protein
MKTQRNLWILLLCIGSCAACGCRRNIVRAAPASVDTPHMPVAPPPQPEPSAPEVVVVQPELTPLPTPSPQPAPAAPAASRPAPARPRPAPADPAVAAKPAPEPTPPQLSPALTPQQQSAAVRVTSNDIRIAEKNLQTSSGRKLNASQSDLAEKVRGFLAQAHEAIRANDWVRAQSLARKAQILSIELIK